MRSKQISFRILGVASFCGGLFAFYDFGSQLLPLFASFIAGSYDAFEVMIVLSSFFLGAVALVWTGIRFTVLQSFRPVWLYFALIPITAWLQKLYAVDIHFLESKAFSMLVVYMCLYVVLASIMRFVHKKWFMPLSHVTGREVGLEKAETSLLYELRWAIVLVVAIVFVIFNPSDAMRLLEAIIAMLVYAFHWIWQ